MIELADHLTRAQRIQRIGELLSKGITLMLMREAKENRATQAAPAPGGGNGAAVEARTSSKGRVAGTGTIRSILDYLQRVGEASPRDIQRSLVLPKTTLYRHLNQLIQAKLVVGTGKTSAIRYRLAGAGVLGGPSGPRFADQLSEDSVAKCA